MYETRSVTYKYSEDEYSAVCDKFARKQIALEELKQEKKDVAKEFSLRIKEAETEQRDLRTCLRTRTETREIEVEGRKNYATGMMEYYGVSGHFAGELVDSRRLTPDEKQLRVDQDETSRTGTQG